MKILSKDKPLNVSSRHLEPVHQQKGEVTMLQKFGRFLIYIKIKCVKNCSQISQLRTE